MHHAACLWTSVRTHPLAARHRGASTLQDIVKHWYYNRDGAAAVQNSPLEPQKVKSKGRPKGALRKKRKDEGVTEIKRDPSAAEYVAGQAPGSTAPGRLTRKSSAVMVEDEDEVLDGVLQFLDDIALSDLGPPKDGIVMS